VQAGVVFGFDHDLPEIFEDTLDFLEETGVQNATFNILTPFPGTPLFRKLEAEGRILTRDWRSYNSRSEVVYQPKRMSRAELLAGFRYANDRFYSLPSMAKRLSRSPAQLCWTLPLNLAYGYSWWKHKQAAVQQPSPADLAVGDATSGAGPPVPKKQISRLPHPCRSRVSRDGMGDAAYPLPAE
jgi:radical SAM superfamily enzyme YgiQ (UPF0313 family)